MRAFALLAFTLAACDGADDKSVDSADADADTDADTDSDTDADSDTDTDSDTDADTDSDTDADTDSDTDADTDSDTDADTDTDPTFTLTLLADDVEYVRYTETEIVSSGEATLTGSPGAWTTLEGSATVYSENLASGTAICDFDVDLVGTATSSPCPTCEFEFDIDASLTRDASSADCDYVPALSWLDTADAYDSSMVLINGYTVPEYTYTNPRTGITYTRGGYDVPERFASRHWRGYYGRPYQYELTIAGGRGYGDPDVDTGAPPPRPDTGMIDTGGSWPGSGGSGTVSLEDATLTWEYTASEWAEEYDWVDPTCPFTESRERGPIGGDVVEAEDLPCDGAYGDVWTVDLTSGQTLTVSVDTVDARTAAYLGAWLNGPDTCTHMLAADNFPCSTGPRTRCPSFEHTVDQDGTWQIVVAVAECLSDTAEYELEVGVH